MKRKKIYRNVKFKPVTIRKALDKLENLSEGEERIGNAIVELNDGIWNHDSIGEFFDDYTGDVEGALLGKYYGPNHLLLNLDFINGNTEVSVMSDDRSAIQSVLAVFDNAVQSANCYTLKNESEPEDPTVFIGHGGDEQWRDLKDHLSDKHGYDVEAYETGSRAGHTIRDVLEDMLDSSSFALLVMTAEDETADSGFRARQNVVHEAGLFQGKLGFSRAIILLEEGAEEFSNIQGVQQIRFSEGNIKETFGEVLATLRREFDTN